MSYTYKATPCSRLSVIRKAVEEDVPMDDNPAYGDVHIYDTA